MIKVCILLLPPFATFIHSNIEYLILITPEYYLAKPYNINLSPLFINDRTFDLDRKFSFSSSATNFLQSNGFDVGAVFTKGVPYLSEQEEVETRERYDQRIERNAKIPSIIFDPSDVGTLDFYRRARASIREWIEAKEVSDFCCVSWVLRISYTVRELELGKMRNFVVLGEHE